MRQRHSTAILAHVDTISPGSRVLPGLALSVAAPLPGALVAVGLFWLVQAACIYRCSRKSGDQFLYTPNTVSNASFHCGCDPQVLMNAAKIAIHAGCRLGEIVER
jgi:hypothetical protein